MASACPYAWVLACELPCILSWCKHTFNLSNTSMYCGFGSWIYCGNVEEFVAWKLIKLNMNVHCRIWEQIFQVVMPYNGEATRAKLLHSFIMHPRSTLLAHQNWHSHRWRNRYIIASHTDTRWFTWTLYASERHRVKVEWIKTRLNKYHISVIKFVSTKWI